MTTNKRMVELRVIENFFFDKALKARGNDTIMFINLKDEILKLPSIPNPIEVIEDLQKECDYGNEIGYSYDYNSALEDVLSKLKS